MTHRHATAALGVMILACGAWACGSRTSPAATEAPTLNVTSWTDKTELYMEYPPLAAQQNAKFAVHLTRLGDFKALNDGRPSLEFTPEGGGATTVLAGTPPLRPGAFRVEGAPPAAGRYRWALKVEARGLADRHDLGSITIYANGQAAMVEAEKAAPDDPTAFAYLKEQQWTNEFATALVRQADLRTAVRVPASIEPLSGGEAVVAAPVAGRFAADELLSIGSMVRSGAVVGRIEPRLSPGEDRATLIAAVSEADAAAEAAHAEQARAERLLAERAVPARRVEEAKRAATVADARLGAARARLTQRDQTLSSGGGTAAGNAFILRAPISGRVAEVSATLGASYDEGAPLFRVIRTDRVELRAMVPATDVGLVRDISQIDFEVPGESLPVPLQAHHMHHAGMIDAQSRALAVQFEVDNPNGRLLIGQTGNVLLYKRELMQVPVVSKAAVLMEAGRPFVFVQVSGERFARRPIEIATRDGDLVGVKSGIKAGDRVVTRGAYDVQLASAAKGLPAEGHVH